MKITLLDPNCVNGLLIQDSIARSNVKVSILYNSCTVGYSHKINKIINCYKIYYNNDHLANLEGLNFIL